MLVHTLWGARTDPFYTTLEDHFHSELTWQGAIIEHREILEAIKSHNPKAARDSMRKHIRRVEKRFTSKWRENE
jgi:DNA-binding GntR family transcriptional regulator